MSISENSTSATLHTVIIQTSYLKKAANFYSEGLDFGEPAPTGGDHLGFPLPNAYIGFDFVEEAPQPSGVISLWFEVQNLEETFQKFQKMGAKVKYPPTAKPWGAILAALHDPDGNLFGLNQRGTGST